MTFCHAFYSFLVNVFLWLGVGTRRFIILQGFDSMCRKSPDKERHVMSVVDGSMQDARSLSEISDRYEGVLV